MSLEKEEFDKLHVRGNASEVLYGFFRNNENKAFTRKEIITLLNPQMKLGTLSVILNKWSKQGTLIHKGNHYMVNVDGRVPKFIRRN